MSGFKKAEKQKAKLRIALAGPSGSGKTYSSLVMAKALGGKVAVVDSERSSALLYADLFEFDHLDLTNHSIGEYKKALKDAAGKYDVLIIDSLSHEWAGRGGALEAVDRKMTNPKENKFSAWNGVSQEHQGLLDDILSFPGHVIATLRKKQEYVLEPDAHTGKMKPRKVGMAPVQRDGIEYEFTAVIGLEDGGAAIVEKSRCPALSVMGETLRRDDLDKAGAVLRDWLASGKDTPVPVHTFTADPITKEVGLIRAAAELATKPEEVDALRPRFNALPAKEQAELKPFLSARKEALQKGAAA